MRFAEFEELNTARLHLRKITMKDALNYFTRLGSCEEVTRYMLFQPHQNILESEAGIQKALRRYETKESLRWVIALKETDELIGVIDLLRFNEKTDSCSFAYMLGRDFWGQGYGTEVLRAVFDYGFSKMELERIEADHMAENSASGAVMRKVGMTCQGIVPEKYEKNQIRHDAVLYVITRKQWLEW